MLIRLVRYVLFPFSVLYRAITRVRNFLYDKQFFKTHRFSLPVINVGNLSTGGTGKSPHVAYLIELLKKEYRIVTLSRGYGRSTQGFLLADKNSSSQQIGDEPMMYFLRYAPEINVAVGENRPQAIEQIIESLPSTEVVLLDDAFQHRAVTPGFNILLTKYSAPYYKDYCLPTGNLREGRNGAERASAIIVTKCPEKLSVAEQEQIIKNIKPLAYQSVYFSCIQYQSPYLLFGKNSSIKEAKQYLALSGIAEADEFEQQIKSWGKPVMVKRFADHYTYKLQDLQNLQSATDKNTIWVTTEKDAARLLAFRHFFEQNAIELWVLPIGIKLLTNEQQAAFNQDIRHFIEATNSKKINLFN